MDPKTCKAKLSVSIYLDTRDKEKRLDFEPLRKWRNMNYVTKIHFCYEPVRIVDFLSLSFISTFISMDEIQEGNGSAKQQPDSLSFHTFPIEVN
uniref:Uncharacterized protein n=1 Tax=Solanum lycopersicum TaxID=4081 RepID=A0A3Q7FAM2_SOLLC